MEKKNPLLELESLGQSVWIDFIRRGILTGGTSGELARLIRDDGVRGVTSNPSIFEKAIVDSHDYDDAIRALALAGRSAEQIVDELTIEDVQGAADLLRPTFDALDGRDGFVSLEVSPRLARDTDATIAEAHRLWAAVARPNVMIKVPATRHGLPAIKRLVADGLHINVTLLFGLPRYREVVEAWLEGLEERASRGEPIAHLSSVASFFLSRIDVLLDPRLEKVEGGDELVGQVAIASAKVAYQMWKQLVAGARFRRLAAQGARAQRLLWASTSTKNPAYSDVKYVEPLIGPQTINTMTLETVAAYRDHGRPAARLDEDVTRASAILVRLHDVDVDLDEATEQLVVEGVEKFAQPWEKLYATVEQRRAEALREPAPPP